MYGTGSQPVQERPSQNVARQVCSADLTSRQPALRTVSQTSLTFGAPKNGAQLAVVLAVCTLALAVCVALISTAELRAARPVAMYGLGSGEEDDADQSQFTAFESMDGPVDVKTGEPVLPGELADEYYVDLFEEIAKAPETEEAVEEVEDAVAVAGKEHEILAAFANDVPDDSTHAPFLSAKEQMGR